MDDAGCDPPRRYTLRQEGLPTMHRRTSFIMLTLTLSGAALALAGFLVGEPLLIAIGVGAAVGSSAFVVCAGAFPATRSETDPAAKPGAANASAVAEPVRLEPERSAPPASPCPAAPSGVEPDDVVAALATAAEAAGEVASAHLWLEDPATSTLRLVSAQGAQRPSGDPVPISGTTLGSALTKHAAVLNAEMLRRTPTGEQTLWRFAVPLDAGDARGVAAVDLSCEQPDREVLTTAAAGLRGAFSGALALHVAREDSAASRALLDTARDLSRLVDPDLVVSTLLARAMRLAGAQTGSVMLLGDDGLLHIACAKGLPDQVVKDTRIAEGEGIAGWVLTTGQPVVVEDLEGKGPRSRRHGVRSAVAVPIADDEGILGVLNVGNKTFHARFSRSHLEALEGLARTGAVALRNARAVESSRSLYFDTLKALALSLETKDPYSRGATERVIDLAVALGAEVGLTDAEQQALHIAAMLHDVGMSAAGDLVAVTDRPLSTVEWGMLKMHPVIAADVLEQAPALREAIPIVYHHHERYDGTGYVTGLEAEQIPIGARVLAVADAYVAITSERPYRRGRTHEEAIDELCAHSGTQFDPDVIRALIDVLGDSARTDVRG